MKINFRTAFLHKKIVVRHINLHICMYVCVACTLGIPITPGRLHISGIGQHLKYLAH